VPAVDGVLELERAVGIRANVNDAYPSMPEGPRATTVLCTSSLNHRPRIRDGHQSSSSESIGPGWLDTDAR
jgi:hypothetical protein